MQGVFAAKFRNFARESAKASLYPDVEKSGGIQSQGANGEAVGIVLQALGNAGSGVLLLSYP
jgi:hypothetical protein